MQDSGPDKHLPGHFSDAEVEKEGFVLFIIEKHLLLRRKTAIIPLKRQEGCEGMGKGNYQERNYHH